MGGRKGGERRRGGQVKEDEGGKAVVTEVV